MRVLPDVLTDHDLPAVELQVLRLDGEAVAIGGGAVPVDLPIGERIRAAGLAVVVGPSEIVRGRSAAWVWGALPVAPIVPEVCRRVGRRTTMRAAAAVPELRLRDDDVVQLAGLALTSPGRTADDLLRDPRPLDADAAEAVRLLVRRSGVDATAVRARLIARGLAGTSRAVHRLAGVDTGRAGDDYAPWTR